MPRCGAHLSVRANGPSAVGEQLGHVVVADELPQASLQVEVPVEAQCAVAPEGGAVLVRRDLADALRVAGGLGDEAVARAHLVVVQQVGAAVVAHARAVRTESQLEVGQRTRGDHRQHT